MGSGSSIDKSEFVAWCTKNIPNVFNGVHSFLLIKLSGAEFDDMSWHQRMSQVCILSISFFVQCRPSRVQEFGRLLFLDNLSLKSSFVAQNCDCVSYESCFRDYHRGIKCLPEEKFVILHRLKPVKSVVSQIFSTSLQSLLI